MNAVENIKKDIIKVSDSYSVEIAVDVKGIQHTFMIITKPNGDEIYRGFVPKTTSLIYDGRIFYINDF